MATHRILIADDDQDDFDLIANLLLDLSSDYEITRAMDGVQLLNYMEECVDGSKVFPDLVLLDINMPKTDGLQALKLIRANKNLPQLPIVMYSTASADEQVKQCFELGADGFVTKSGSLKDVMAFTQQLHDFFNLHATLPGTDRTMLIKK